MDKKNTILLPPLPQTTMLGNHSPSTKPWYRSKWSVFAATLVLSFLAVVVLLILFHNREDEWTLVSHNHREILGKMSKDDPDFSREKTHFVDTYNRFTGKIIYREICHYDDKHELVSVAQGPMSPGNNPHGEWQLVLFNPDRLVRIWYWYGETITEADWVSRNKNK